MPDLPTTPPQAGARPAQDWRVLVAVFWVTSFIESMGVAQIFALLPAYLRQMGVDEADRLAFVGLFSSLVFLVGLPLVPLWGVWADKYSRKAVIIRSAIVEAVVFAGVALSQEPWQLALSMLLIGFQLGNTGVMLAGIRDVTPLRRLGVTIAVFGSSGPIGFAFGPAIAGILVDGLGWSLPGVFWLSAALSVGTALLVALTREIRPEVIPTGSVISLAFGAMRSVLTDKTVRRIFLIFGISYLATQMSRPYIPILVEEITGSGAGLASAIALVMGAAALVGALISPLGGLIGDRIGFRPVLIAALAFGGVILLLMPLAHAVPALALLAVVLGISTATVTSMIFGLLALDVPADRRSATLNLVYLPLYAAGIVGPAVGAAVASVGGVAGPFIAGGAVFLFGAATVYARVGATSRGARASAGA